MNSILVIQLKRLGDVILTTPALGELRKLYPEAQITLLLDHRSAAVAPAIAAVNEVWIYNRNASFNLWFDLVRRGFDLCLDFTGSDRSALVSFFRRPRGEWGLVSSPNELRVPGAIPNLCSRLCEKNIRRIIIST